MGGLCREVVFVEVFNVVEHIKEGALDLQRGSLHMGGDCLVASHLDANNSTSVLICHHLLPSSVSRKLPPMEREMVTI